MPRGKKKEEAKTEQKAESTRSVEKDPVAGVEQVAPGIMEDKQPKFQPID